MPTKLKTTQDFIDGYDKGRAEVIEEVQHIINKYSEYARPVGWSKKTEIICTSILREELEQLKENK